MTAKEGRDRVRFDYAFQVQRSLLAAATRTRLPVKGKDGLEKLVGLTDRDFRTLFGLVNLTLAFCRLGDSFPLWQLAREMGLLPEDLCRSPSSLGDPDKKRQHHVTANLTRNVHRLVDAGLIDYTSGDIGKAGRYRIRVGELDLEGYADRGSAATTGAGTQGVGSDNRSAYRATIAHAVVNRDHGQGVPSDAAQGVRSDAATAKNRGSLRTPYRGSSRGSPREEPEASRKASPLGAAPPSIAPIQARADLTHDQTLLLDNLAGNPEWTRRDVYDYGHTAETLAELAVRGLIAEMAPFELTYDERALLRILRKQPSCDVKARCCGPNKLFRDEDALESTLFLLTNASLLHVTYDDADQMCGIEVKSTATEGNNK
ncbi:MAG: hypothetical protein ACRDZ8_21545 [Acidimicrobiales bacterium]